MLSLASPRIAPYFLNLKKDSKSAENHPFFVRKIRRDTVHVYFQYLGATVGQRPVDKIRDFFEEQFFQSFFRFLVGSKILLAKMGRSDLVHFRG